MTLYARYNDWDVDWIPHMRFIRYVYIPVTDELLDMREDEDFSKIEKFLIEPENIAKLSNFLSNKNKPELTWRDNLYEFHIYKEDLL